MIKPPNRLSCQRLERRRVRRWRTGGGDDSHLPISVISELPSHLLHSLGHLTSPAAPVSLNLNSLSTFISK